MILKGKPIFFIKELLLNPAISNPMILYPACGTFAISIFPFAPTNNISIVLSFFFKALAFAIAGKICPPVPPPAIIILLLMHFHLPFLFFPLAALHFLLHSK